MDILAVLLAMSIIPGHRFREAGRLIWYGKRALQDPHLDRPSNERQNSSLEPSDPQYEVKVLRKTPESQILEPFDRSKGRVVALVQGQALNCGIGPCLEDSTTYLSAKDVLRWSKIAEWLDKHEPRNSRHEIAVSQSEDLGHRSSLLRKLSDDPSGERLPRNAVSVHVSDLPGHSLGVLDSETALEAMSIVVENDVLLTLLVGLPLVYGGIHLTTWNFHFASQTEHLLWKIVCIDIMGTIPLGVTFFACLSPILVHILRYSLQRRHHMNMTINILETTVSLILFTSLFIFYALSRIYIVVESFISLRHVPIGVYAAIPWVQDIPHI